MGSLPWYVKVLLSIAGLHGDRARGIAEMERASQKGHWAREDAKFVLVAVYRREKMYDKGSPTCNSLRNPIPATLSSNWKLPAFTKTGMIGARP